MGRMYGRMNMLSGIQPIQVYPAQYTHHQSLGEHSRGGGEKEGRR